MNVNEFQYSKRPQWRARGGSSVEFMDLCVARPPVPVHAVDVPLPNGWPDDDTILPSVLAARQLVSYDQFNRVKTASRVASAAVCATVTKRMLLYFGWLPLAAIIAGVALLASRGPDVDYDRTQENQTIAGSVLIGISIFLAMALMITTCIRATRARIVASMAAVAREAEQLQKETGGRVTLTTCTEKLTMYLQEEGRGRITLYARDFYYLRFTIPHTEAPLHAEMTQASHMYIPGKDGFLIGGDGKLVAVPPPPPGCILVSPHDLMSPAHGHGDWSLLPPLQIVYATPAAHSVVIVPSGQVQAASRTRA